MVLWIGNRNSSFSGHTMKRPHVTLILPVYNEDLRLPRGLRLARTYLSRQQYTWEIRVVDDGSVTPARDLIPKTHLPVFIHRLDKHRGKGAAIAYGVAQARGKYIVFSDIDFSVKITTLPAILSALSRAPVVIASRRAPGSTIGTHQPVLRETAGRLFTFFSNALLGIRVFDSTCGFKGFERGSAKRLFADLVIGGWVFDTEVIWRARRLHMPIVQIPVHWSDKKGTRVHVADVLHSWADLLKLWVYASTHT